MKEVYDKGCLEEIIIKKLISDCRIENLKKIDQAHTHTDCVNQIELTS